jgi:hypothetical protein
MNELSAVVTITRDQASHPVDREVHVKTLAELFEVCRNAPPAHLVRVALRGPEGEVTLTFANFMHSAR